MKDAFDEVFLDKFLKDKVQQGNNLTFYRIPVQL